MPKALFVTYGGGHVTMTIPVVEELQRRGDWEITVLGLTTAKARLQEAGIPSLGFLDLVEPGDEQAIALGRSLADEHHSEGLEIDLEESIAYLGLSYQDLISKVGREKARSLLKEQGRASFLPTTPIKRLIHRIQPDVVLATNSPRAERAAIVSAQEMGIPALCLIDLNGREQAHLFAPDFADRLLLLSEDVRNDFITAGRPADELIVTGNPAFDRLIDPKHRFLAKSWRNQHGLEGKKVILWALSPPGSEEWNEKIIHQLTSCLENNPDWSLVYRPHPSMKTDSDALPPNTIQSSHDTAIPTLLHAADVVLVTLSTVGLEAAFLHKPVVKMCLVSPDFFPVEEMGLAFPVNDLSQLGHQLEIAFTDCPQTQSLAAEQSHLPSLGDAAARVSDVIESATHSSFRLTGGRPQNRTDKAAPRQNRQSRRAG